MRELHVQSPLPANVNAFEQNKGVGTNATLWTSDRRKKKEGFAALGGMRPVVHSYFALFNRARFRRGTGRAFIVTSTDTMRHGPARRDATRPHVFHAGHGDASE